MDDNDILERIEKLERDSHPPIGLCEFEGFQELNKRIDAIEEKVRTMYEYNVTIVKVVDGDTVDVDIDLGFGMTYKKQRVRMLGIDTLGS